MSAMNTDGLTDRRESRTFPRTPGLRAISLGATAIILATIDLLPTLLVSPKWDFSCVPTSKNLRAYNQDFWLALAQDHFDQSTDLIIEGQDSVAHQQRNELELHRAEIMHIVLRIPNGTSSNEWNKCFQTHFVQCLTACCLCFLFTSCAHKRCVAKIIWATTRLPLP